MRFKREFSLTRIMLKPTLPEMKGARPSKPAIVRKEHKDQDVAELLLRLSPNDPNDVKKARQIAEEYFLLKGKALEEFIAKWSEYSDDD